MLVKMLYLVLYNKCKCFILPYYKPKTDAKVQQIH